MGKEGLWEFCERVAIKIKENKLKIMRKCEEERIQEKKDL